MRSRDGRFKDQQAHKQKPHPLHHKGSKTATPDAKCYRPKDFSYDPDVCTRPCPAGTVLYQNGSNCIHNGYISVKFQGTKRDCVPCDQRKKCLRTANKTATRQVSPLPWEGRRHPELHGSDEGSD